MARSQSTSSGSSDLDPSTSTEEKGRDSIDEIQGCGKAGDFPHNDSEKQPAGLRRLATRDSNTQAIPGVQLDESDFEDSAGHAPGAVEDHGSRGSGVSGLAERVLSRTTSRSSFNPGPPPDGGLKAWTAVAAGHLVIMNTWGYINSFGVFQTYYATELGLPPATISWIGSIQVFLLFFIGTFTGRITDAGLFLAQGVCMGIGNGCLFCPTVATVSTYFSKKRGLAIGMTACGSATGGLIFPAMARQLLPTAGFPWTVRAIGFIQLTSLIVANIGLKRRIPPRKAGALVEWAAFKELEYTFYAAGSFSCFLGVYFAFYYLASYSRDIIGLSYVDSLNLLLLLNGIGIIGRLVPNHLADRWGPINVFVPTAVIAGVCQLTWIAVTNPSGLYAWAVFFGIAAGGIQSLFPAGLSSLTTDLRKSGTRMGMVFTIVSFATLTGPPIAGAIISSCGGQYYGAQAFAGGTMILGGGFMMAAKVVKQRRLGGGWKGKV
ncbi:major facilitator superfamily transporter [Diaporthe amygdali]|uniref:major facilitator superfamily transporter n=1 Tax=Phomopsis amygdali TaxID=1214568 RepID=UPI0022FF3FA0|nr:major facilitator superfamily transporter [Diaporthe amygdali]KAJ0115851.1 major facilitator superfamily transporter [Diaporthe amygdali]